MGHAIIAGLVAVALLVWHERRGQKQWRRSINECRARAIGRKLEQDRQQQREYDDAQWARIRRVVATAPLRGTGRPLATMWVDGGAR